jgi:hypothetical protein
LVPAATGFSWVLAETPACASRTLSGSGRLFAKTNEAPIRVGRSGEGNRVALEQFDGWAVS